MADETRKGPSHHIEGNKVVVVDEMTGNINVVSKTNNLISVNLIPSLVDLCNRLLRLRQESKQSELLEKIMLVYEEFQSQHSHYLQCFQNYRSIVRASPPENANHPVYDEIRRDHVLSQGARAKLAALSERVSSRQQEQNKFHPENQFIKSIVSYFIWTNAAVHYDGYLGPDSNIPRSCLLSGLTYISNLSPEQTKNLAQLAKKDRRVWVIDEFSLGYIHSDLQWKQFKRELDEADGDVAKTKIALAIGLIENIMSYLQGRYGYITKEYLKVKEDLSE